jgi:hypothetical protein
MMFFIGFGAGVLITAWLVWLWLKMNGGGNWWF